jgi:thiamine-monophosphate kinase
LWTIDTQVENSHFSLKYSTPKQIGKKAMEINVSDIGAMNGKPLYALVSLCLKKNTLVSFVDELYEGIYSVAKKYGIDVVGGNTTHGEQIVVDIALLGEAIGKIPLRSNAKPGDLIIASGNLGSSKAGLELLLKNKKGFVSLKKKHLEPVAQLKKALALSKYANAMEDCSDGLASETKNICEASNCGAILFWKKIPVSVKTKKAAFLLGKDAREFALFGGEDYELIATVPKKHLKKVDEKYFVVGRIIKEKKIFLEKNGKKSLLKKSGYDHFA